MPQAETVLQLMLVEEIQKLGPQFRSWKRVNGNLRSPHSERRIQVGIFSSGDVHGYIARTGTIPIPFEIEAKWGKGRLSEDQENWRRFCATFGIPWFRCYARTAITECFREAARATAQEIKQLESAYAARP